MAAPAKKTAASPDLAAEETVEAPPPQTPAAEEGEPAARAGGWVSRDGRWVLEEGDS